MGNQKKLKEDYSDIQLVKDLNGQKGINLFVFQKLLFSMLKQEWCNVSDTQTIKGLQHHGYFMNIKFEEIKEQNKKITSFKIKVTNHLQSC
jgi:hypothetical protein